MNSELRYRKISDAGKRRSISPKTLDESGHTLALDIDKDSLARIRYISPETESAGKVIDKRPESDALDNAPDYDLSPFSH